MRRPAVISCALALTVAGCGVGSADDPLRVFAASSMSDVLPEIAESFEDANGASVETSFGASSTLREQILDGAEVDVFISANEVVMQGIVDAGLAAGAPTRFAEASVVIAVPTGNPGEVGGLSDLADADLTIGLCASEVPCGHLADTILREQGVTASVDTREPNVRALLAKVELGELDAALVYSPDVESSTESEAIELDGDADARAVYFAAPLADAAPRAGRFVDWLASEGAMAILETAGFEAP